MSKRKPKQSEIAAIEAIKKNIRSSRAKGNLVEVAEYYNQLGNQHRLLGNFEDALDAHQEEVNISKRFSKDKMGLGIAYRNLGEVSIEMKKEDEAIRYIKMYLKIAQDCNNYVEQQRAFITWGRAYLSMSERDESEENGNSENRLDPASALEKGFQSFKKAYLLLEEDELIAQIKDKKELMLMKCNNCQNIGIALELQGKFSDAATWLEKAVDIGIKYKFDEHVAPCYTILCGLLLKEGKRKEALDAAKSATKIARTLGNLVWEVEAQMLEAKALFMNDEVDTGKKILKRLRLKISRKQELSNYFEELDSLLTAAVRISRTQDNLFVTENDDAEAKTKLHEVLGDNYSTLMNYEAAIVHYKKACEYARRLGIEGKKLAQLYYSIAESYRDLEKYANALEYYRKEMTLHSGNSVEEFRTQTKITVVLEKLNKPPEEVIAAHNLAILFAKKTKSATREVTALTNLSLYLKSVGQRRQAEENIEKANEIKAKYNITNSDDHEPDSQEILDEDEDDPIDLENLSEEDNSDDEAEDDKRTVKKRVNARVNEAGESQLHIAAKKGDLKAVRRLIRQGHTVKSRDNAGWTPLHEACNFGHAAVVEELLKNGADVNDAGGALAEKITPLHDAACNCHCDVIKVLVKYGANVLARDVEHRYPIDSLLAWRESDIGMKCSEDELVAYREVKSLLKDRMAEAGKPYRVQDEQRTRKRARVNRSRSRSPQQSVLLVTKPYDEACPILAKTMVDDYDPDREGNGEEFYKKTMKQVGRKSLEDRGSRKEKVRAMSPGPRGALIPSEKDFHQKHEDWLLPDDMDIPSTSKNHQPGKPKRKRDPMEDVIRDERSTRRRTGNNSTRVRKNDEEVPSSDEELMDIESPTRHITTNDPSSPGESISRNSDSEEIGPGVDLVDEDFSDLMNDDFGMEDVPLGGDDFLPSQRPPRSSVEFGTTIDVPVVEDSDDGREDNDTTPVIRVGRKKKNSSPTKRFQAVTIISSDEDDDFETTSRNANKLKYSELSSVLKQTNNSRQTDKANRKEKSMVQTKLPVKIVPRNGRNNADSDASIDSPPFETSTLRRRTTSSSSLTNHRPCVDDKQKKETLRLKIRILDKVLLVPVDDKHMNESIDWLAKESATRYLRSYGEKPILTLQTKDGATLLGSDPISLVLDANERELNGIVTNFDLLPLVERYCSACSDASLEVDPDVKSNLNNCQSSNILNLCDVYLRDKSCSVLMNALQRQRSLRTLVLSGCSLFDSGLSELCKALPTLSGLTELDISSNGITKAGFISFVDVFSQQNQPNESIASFSSVPVGLTSLVLNHNPLGNQIGTALATLLTKLSALRRLELSDCDLSEKLLLGNRNDLSKAFNNSRLEELDISFNAFKEGGLEKILQSLPARRMRNLNCSSCYASSNVSSNDAVAKAIGTFLSGNEDCCNLKTLQLNDCGLSDKSMDLILDNFDRLVRLESLELACNDSLTALSLVNILERAVERETPLMNLDMGSIPNLWSTSRVSNEQVLAALSKKLNSQKKLAALRVPSSDVNFENSNIIEENASQTNLSKLEQKVVEIMSDYAGSTDFKCEKQGACIIYRFED